MEESYMMFNRIATRTKRSCPDIARPVYAHALGDQRERPVFSQRLMVHGITYVEQGLKKYEEKVAQTEQRLLQKLARKYNMVLQPRAA